MAVCGFVEETGRPCTLNHHHDEPFTLAKSGPTEPIASTDYPMVIPRDPNDAQWLTQHPLTN
ncbi:GD14274 [Drosophila simulans]|uniref:GD14274 n=1 Tax=Drosophila simulans TaxID=7240 RepID=B4QPM7_DROSI|nr:GD14274 [Drosophila simulans]